MVDGSRQGVGVPCQRSKMKKKIKIQAHVCFIVGNISGIYDRNSTDWIKKFCLFPCMLDEKIKKRLKSLGFFFLSGMVMSYVLCYKQLG